MFTAILYALYTGFVNREDVNFLSRISKIIGINIGKAINTHKNKSIYNRSS